MWMRSSHGGLHERIGSGHLGQVAYAAARDAAKRHREGKKDRAEKRSLNLIGPMVEAQYKGTQA